MKTKSTRTPKAPKPKASASGAGKKDRDLTKAEVKAVSDRILTQHAKVMDVLAKL